MKTINIITTVLLLLLLDWYGYSVSMTEEGFILSGYIGTAIPAVVGTLLYFIGYYHAQS